MNKIRLTESQLHRIIKESVNKVLNEGFKNNLGYTHFIVNKATGKICGGWDYSDEDPADLRAFKRDYFINDMIDWEFDPKEYKVVGEKFLRRQGIDPDDNNNWSNR